MFGLLWTLLVLVASIDCQVFSESSASGLIEQIRQYIDDAPAIEDFLEPYESQQVSVIASAVPPPEVKFAKVNKDLSTDESKYSHHKEHDSGHHKGHHIKGNKEYHIGTGRKDTHKLSHGEKYKAKQHNKGGKNYKGGEHKHRHHKNKANGVKGHKSHDFGHKRHHNKGNKAKGFKNIWHNEESGRSKKFHDDSSNKKYHSHWDDFDSFHTSKGDSFHKGGSQKGLKHHKKYGKKALNDKGKYNNAKKGEKKSYGHKGRFGHQSKHKKGGGRKELHHSGHRGNGQHGHGDHHSGSYSVHTPVKTNYEGSDSSVVPFEIEPPSKFESRSFEEAAPISMFMKNINNTERKGESPSSSENEIEETEEERSLPKDQNLNENKYRVREGNYRQYMKNPKHLSDHLIDDLSEPELNEISDYDEIATKSEKTNKLVGKPIIVREPSRTYNYYEDRIPSPSALVPIPVMTSGKSQQISVVSDVNMIPEESGGGHHKSMGHKAAHHKTTGENAEKGNKLSTGYNKNNRGGHLEKHHSNFKDRKTKKYQSNDHKKKYKGNHHKAKKGKKGHKSGSKGNHSKGHNDKGFKNVHHKFEYAVKKNFYLDKDDKTHHSEIDEFDTFFKKKMKENMKDHQFQGGNHDANYNKKTHKGKGSSFELKKGLKKQFGRKGHHGKHRVHGHKRRNDLLHLQPHDYDDLHGDYSNVDYDYLYF